VIVSPKENKGVAVNFNRQLGIVFGVLVVAALGLLGFLEYKLRTIKGQIDNIAIEINISVAPSVEEIEAEFAFQIGVNLATHLEMSGVDYIAHAFTLVPDNEHYREAKRLADVLYAECSKEQGYACVNASIRLNEFNGRAVR
jgi:hypothetical protein